MPIFALHAKRDPDHLPLRAERRLGEMIKAQKDAGGLNTGAMGIGKSAVEHHDRTPTLADVGISKDLSSRAQKIASIPAPEFEEAIADHRHEREPWREAA
jgi:hypothetical protein